MEKVNGTERRRKERAERKWIVVHEFIDAEGKFLRRTRPKGKVQLSDRAYQVGKDGSLRRI